MPPPKDPIKYAMWLQRNKDSHRGKILPEATRKKMSESRKGNKNNLGNIASAETRKKMSKAKIGNKYSLGNKASEVTKQKMSIAHKGIPKSEEWKQKIAESHTGMHHLSEESKQRIGKARTELYSGENHPNWKGGISFEPYCPKFNEQFRRRVRAFFNHTCVLCGATQSKKNLHVHHIHYQKDSCCNGDSPKMFAALCDRCHSKTNYNREHWTGILSAIIINNYGGRSYLTEEEYQT